MTEDLKPCRFCGARNTHHSSNGVANHFVECDECGASGPACETEDEAIAAWNQRTPPKVKALKWMKRDVWWAEFPPLMSSYSVFFEQGKWWVAQLAEAPPFGSEEEAKAYVQEHVNRRVLACLEGYDD